MDNEINWINHNRKFKTPVYLTPRKKHKQTVKNIKQQGDSTEITWDDSKKEIQTSMKDGENVKTIKQLLEMTLRRWQLMPIILTRR